MDPLIGILPRVVQNAGGSAEATEAAAIAAWKLAAGEGIRAGTAALSLTDKRLIVAVADAVWQKQLSSIGGQLLARLNAFLGQPVVRNIEFRIDPGKVVSPKRLRPDGGQSNRMQPLPRELVTAANSIRDPALRNTFLRTAVGNIRLREERR
jgi:hypothetical protein